MRKNNNKIRSIISTFGPLHLIKSAESLADVVDIRVIQGWIPNKFNKFLLRIASKVVGRDLSKTIIKRTPTALKNRNKSVGFPEFYLWSLRYFSSADSQKSALSAARLYGLFSKKHIRKADVFHVRSGSGMGGAIERAHRQGMKVVVDHSIAHPAFMDRQLRGDYRKNSAKFDLGIDSPFWQGVLADCNKADCLLVNSDFVKDTFIAEGYDPMRIKVVYLGVRSDFWRLKTNYDVSPRIKILFTGSFGFRKGAEYLLQALCRLDELGFPYEMTIVGSYEQSSDLVDRYKPKHIRFAGHIPQDELKGYLATSDIYLFPSLCEGCASSAMEAMAAGLPVIVTKEAGLPMEHRENGIVVPSKNVEDIVKTILLLSDNKQLREKIGMNGAKTISTQYTWDKYAESVFKVYSSLLKD